MERKREMTRVVKRGFTYLMIKRKTPQKHISTASTENMLDSSATDTRIAVIVSHVRDPSPSRPPQLHRVIRRPYPHTCTHTRTRGTTTTTTATTRTRRLSVSPHSFSLSLHAARLSAVNRNSYFVCLLVASSVAFSGSTIRGALDFERAVVDTTFIDVPWLRARRRAAVTRPTVGFYVTITAADETPPADVLCSLS